MGKFHIGTANQPMSSNPPVVADVQISTPVEIVRYVDRVIEKPVEVVKYIEKIVEKPVEVIKYIETIVEKPVEVIKEKIVHTEPVIKEIIKHVHMPAKEIIKTVEKEIPVYIDKIKPIFKVPNWAVIMMILMGCIIIVESFMVLNKI